MDRFEKDTGREDQLILVDVLDREIGSATKEKVHLQGMLHRAFSVVLVRRSQAGYELLITRRARDKYHSAGCWANSVCSHPRWGEKVKEAAYRRVQEELGVTAWGLREIGCFVYRSVFEGGVTEYEADHVLIGTCEGTLHPDEKESDACAWVGMEELNRQLTQTPERFAVWAQTVLPMAIRELAENGLR